MYRITRQRTAESIQHALGMLPTNLYRVLKNTHFFTENPLFCGVAEYENDGKIQDGRDYRSTSHTLFGRWHTHDKITTIALPELDIHPWVIIHELGHVLDDYLNFAYDLQPNCEYAEKDRYEAFACAFQGWFYRIPDVDPAIDYRNDRWFRNLARDIA